MADDGRLSRAATGDDEEWGDPWDDYRNGRAAFEDLSDEDQPRVEAHGLRAEAPIPVMAAGISGRRAFVEAPDVASMSDDDIAAFAKSLWTAVVGHPPPAGDGRNAECPD